MHRPTRRQEGYALIVSLIVVVVTAGLVLGFIAQVNTQQKIGINDVDYGGAFYAAEAGLEKLNADLSKLFAETVFPTSSALSEIQDADHKPSISGVTYSTYSVSGGQLTRLTVAMTTGSTTATVQSTAGWPTSGYFMVGSESITYTGTTSTTFTGLTRAQNGTTAAAHPVNQQLSRSSVITLSEGSNAGLNAQVIPFTLSVVVQAGSGSEAKLSRDIQVALIPVFQFGVFSESDLSFVAGPNFSFGGRVHTNGYLFLAHLFGNTLTLSQKVTTPREVIRAVMTNGWSTATVYTGTVNVVKTPGTYRALARTEGSVTGGIGSSTYSGWNNLSLTTYNGNILNGATGARALNLPFTASGASPVSIINRALAADDPILSESRLYNQASLRVLLSDAQTSLPGNTGYPLNSTLSGYTVDATHPPFAAADPNDLDYVTATNADETASTPLIDGYIRIDMQNANGDWQDVTMEILNLGIATSNADAIIRFQKLKPTKSAGSVTGTDYMPLSLFDTREGRFRETSTTGVRKIGIMGLVDLDVNNLKKWFNGTIGSSGTQAYTDNGYIFYFSDRRGNRNASGNETGEFGFEDVANPSDDANGQPNGTLNGTPEAGEDFNSDSVLQTYGGDLPVSPYTAYPTNTDLYSMPVNGQSTTLSTAMASATSPADGGTITVASTSGWTAPGFVVIGNEAITFTGKTGTTFTGITRGAYGSVAAAHTSGSAVTVGQSTTLSAGLSTTINQTGVTASAPANGGTLTVASTTGWPTTGTLTAGSEIISYTGKTTTTFTGITRGAYSTSAASHSNGSTVTGDQVLSATNPGIGQTMGLTSTAALSTSGILVVGAEYITYSNKTQTNVTVAGRGQLGSTAAAHASGTTVTNSAKAQKNRVWYFRRALRLINGIAPNLPTPGFTVAAENPVYIQGDYNVSGGSFTSGTHSYAAVIADAVTMLSNSWKDERSFDFPYSIANRQASTTWYRAAIAAGKGRYFTPGSYGITKTEGTDGGVHNFLRYIEDWNNGSILHYTGSLVSLYYSRQATGIYKCCSVTYDAPTRDYSFDTEFLVPAQLPPGTPRFRDINNLSFRQTIRADQ